MTATPFRNPTTAEIQVLLRRSRTLAVIGLSDDPARPSFGVSHSMLEYGYRILPVNPALREWLGMPAYPNLDAAVHALTPGTHVDIVNVFRRPVQVDQVVDDCLRLGLGTLWLQQGVVNEPAARRAREAGMTVVMDRCIYVDRAAMPE